MKILITDLIDPLFFKLLKKNNIKYVCNMVDSQNDILKNINAFDGLVLRNRLQIDEKFLHQAQNLKFIARYGSGMESVNTKKAHELGILCFNSAEGNRNAVGEHTLGLLLCLLHNISRSMLQLKNSICVIKKHM